MLSPDQKMCVQYFNLHKSWKQARSYCQSLGHGIDLVTISNENDNAFLTKLLKSYVGVNAWTGATCQEYGCQFKWVANGKPVSYTNWTYYGPMYGAYQNCITLLIEGTWSTDECSDPIYFICQKQIWLKWCSWLKWWWLKMKWCSWLKWSND